MKLIKNNMNKNTNATEPTTIMAMNIKIVSLNAIKSKIRAKNIENITGLAGLLAKGGK